MVHGVEHVDHRCAAQRIARVRSEFFKIQRDDHRTVVEDDRAQLVGIDRGKRRRIADFELKLISADRFLLAVGQRAPRLQFRQPARQLRRVCRGDHGGVHHGELVGPQEVACGDRHNGRRPVVHVDGDVVAQNGREPAARIEIGRRHHDVAGPIYAVGIGVVHVADGRRPYLRHRVERCGNDGRNGGGIVRRRGPGVLTDHESVLQRIRRRGDVVERAVPAQQRSAAIVRIAEDVRGTRAARVALRRELRAHQPRIGMNAEVPDFVPVRELIGRANDLVAAQLHAEARPDVLPPGRASGGPVLLQDCAAPELRAEIHIRAADPLDVDQRRERRQLEVGAAVIDAEVAARIRRSRSQRIVLKPVDVERAHDRAGNRRPVVTRREAAADHPGIEQPADIAPESPGNAVLPRGGELAVARLLPQWLQRGDRELARLHRLPPRFAAWNGSAIHVDLEGFAGVLLFRPERETEVAVGVGLALGNQGRCLGLDLVVVVQAQRQTWIGDCQRRRVLFLAVSVQPNHHVGEWFQALLAQVTTEPAFEQIAHSRPSFVSI